MRRLWLIRGWMVTGITGMRQWLGACIRLAVRRAVQKILFARRVGNFRRTMVVTMISTDCSIRHILSVTTHAATRRRTKTGRLTWIHQYKPSRCPSCVVATTTGTPAACAIAAATATTGRLLASLLLPPTTCTSTARTCTPGIAAARATASQCGA